MRPASQLAGYFRLSLRDICRADNAAPPTVIGSVRCLSASPPPVILTRSFHRTNPAMTDPTPSRVYFENSAPILRVEDMKAALAFYVDKLGFQNASWGTEDFTSVNRDRAGIYLCRGGQGRGAAWVWIGVEDATRLHNELAARGVAIRMPLTNFNWALEFHVEDPDGNVLRFGSEPLAGNTLEALPRWEHGG